MHHDHPKEIYGPQKETRALEHYHQHYIYWYTNNMNIPFQLKWSKSFSILYDTGHIFLNAAHNFGGTRVEDVGSRTDWWVNLSDYFFLDLQAKLHLLWFKILCKGCF